MPKSEKGNDPWLPRHTEILARAEISLLLANRPNLSHTPGLEGEVNGHGGNRVSQKVIEHCKSIAAAAGMGKEVVQEEIDKLKKGGKKDFGPNEKSPVKPLAKKRKVEEMKLERE